MRSAVHKLRRVTADAAARVFATAVRRGLPRRGVLLLVEVAAQRMIVITGDGVLQQFVISTAANGLGCERGSSATPFGWHRVAARIGGNKKIGQVFVSRRATTEILAPAQWRGAIDGDRIVSRILRLAGLEPGVNQGGACDSFTRFIYIHGTNQEQRLGKPASHGCVRMSNRDVVELFDLVAHREAWCWIGLRVRDVFGKA